MTRRQLRPGLWGDDAIGPVFVFPGPHPITILIGDHTWYSPAALWALPKAPGYRRLFLGVLHEYRPDFGPLLRQQAGMSDAHLMLSAWAAQQAWIS